MTLSSTSFESPSPLICAGCPRVAVFVDSFLTFIKADSSTAEQLLQMIARRWAVWCFIISYCTGQE
ncbi:hypothetical protein T11_8277, partial [Trichinella zimbabwensis]